MWCSYTSEAMCYVTDFSQGRSVSNSKKDIWCINCNNYTERLSYCLNQWVLKDCCSSTCPLVGRAAMAQGRPSFEKRASSVINTLLLVIINNLHLSKCFQSEKCLGDLAAWGLPACCCISLGLMQWILAAPSQPVLQQWSSCPGAFCRSPPE